MATQYHKVCEYCGREFTSEGPRALLCPKCRGDRYKKPENCEEVVSERNKKAQEKEDQERVVS
jgi:hypothetical protein